MKFYRYKDEIGNSGKRHQEFRWQGSKNEKSNLLRKPINPQMVPLKYKAGVSRYLERLRNEPPKIIRKVPHYLQTAANSN